MSNEVKAKVADHHFKENVKVGDTRLTKRKPETVKVNTTLRNMVQAGNVIVTEGSISPEKSEKSFQENDGSGENSEEGLGEEDLKDLTVDELKEKCESEGLKKSGTKSELIERLKNSE